MANQKITGPSLTTSNVSSLGNLSNHAINTSYVDYRTVATIDGDANINVKAEGKLTITDADGNEYDVIEFLKTVSERLLVLHPVFEAHEKYPALKEAYDHYKMMEALLLNGSKKE